MKQNAVFRLTKRRFIFVKRRFLVVKRRFLVAIDILLSLQTDF